jgi:hypothetical protein
MERVGERWRWRPMEAPAPRAPTTRCCRLSRRRARDTVGASARDRGWIPGDCHCLTQLVEIPSSARACSSTRVSRKAANDGTAALHLLTTTRMRPVRAADRGFMLWLKVLADRMDFDVWCVLQR